MRGGRTPKYTNSEQLDILDIYSTIAAGVGFEVQRILRCNGLSLSAAGCPFNPIV